jgi:hypothetical protein
MTNEPRIIILLDLRDGLPPITCNSPQEAAFFADVWLGYHGDADALARLRSRDRESLVLANVIASEASDRA